VPPTNPTISNISVFKKGFPGLTQDDHKSIKKWVAFAIDKILGCTLPFCQQDAEKPRTAVACLEKREPRLVVCEFGWGALVILSHALQNRRPRRRRGCVAGGADIGAPSTAQPDGSGTAGAGGDAPPAQVTAEQQLAQEQLDVLNQLSNKRYVGREINRKRNTRNKAVTRS